MRIRFDWNILLTAVIAVTGVLAAIVYNRQLTVMQAQLDSMRYDQRPWVSLSMNITGPLERTSSGWQTLIAYKLENVGKSPAIDVDFLPVLVPLGPPAALNNASQFPNPAQQIKNATERACGLWREHIEHPYGQIMFPAEQQTKQFIVHQLENTPDHGFVPSFAVIGCATYKIQGDSAVHRTTVSLDVGKRSYELIDLRGGVLQPEDLSAAPSPGGSSAN